MRAVLLLLSALLLLPCPALARKGKPPTGAKAEAAILAVHRSYAEAVLESDWAKAAHCFEPAALAGIRETLTPFFAGDSGDGKTVGELLVSKSMEELAALDDAEFFGAFISGIIAMNPGVGEALAQAAMVEKGVAFGAPGEAYVVYEMSLNTEGVDMTKLAVTPVVQTDDGTWALRMTGEFRGLADAFARLAAQGKEVDAQAGEEAEQPEP